MKPIQVYLTTQEHQDLKVLAAQEGMTITQLIRAALALDYTKQKAPTPVAREQKESPAVIRNLAEVEYVHTSDKPQYDPTRPLWSPYGTIPLEPNPMNPKAVCDPNLDPDQWIPMDVAERNAWLERE